MKIPKAYTIMRHKLTKEKVLVLTTQGFASTVGADTRIRLKNYDVQWVNHEELEEVKK